MEAVSLGWPRPHPSPPLGLLRLMKHDETDETFLFEMSEMSEMHRAYCAVPGSTWQYLAVPVQSVHVTETEARFSRRPAVVVSVASVKLTVDSQT